MGILRGNADYSDRGHDHETELALNAMRDPKENAIRLDDNDDGHDDEADLARTLGQHVSSHLL